MNQGFRPQQPGFSESGAGGPFVFPGGRRASLWARVLALGLIALRPLPGRAEPVDFNLPAQPAADALLAFSRQAQVELLFSFEDLREVRSTEVVGRYEPVDALSRLLRGTGFMARRNDKGKFAITRLARRTGSIRGRLLASDGAPARGVHVTLFDENQSTETDAEGEFGFTAVSPGIYRLDAGGAGYLPQEIVGIRVLAGRVTIVDTRVMPVADEVTHLAPYVVTGESDRGRLFDGSGAYLGPRVAAGNLDLPRTANDALPFAVYGRQQIQSSGVVNLNEFLQRELVDSDAGNRPPDQDASNLLPNYAVGSTNLNLRGYGDDETVVLVNGRRLPEVVTSGGAGTLPPDVNFIPLSLVQQIEVLSSSAASLYTGNPVGGVINIVLRPDPEGEVTEVNTTYTNALRRFDAPFSSVSLLHGQTLLGGALRLRLSASFTRMMPATEAELGYIHANVRPSEAPDNPVYRATPNLRSADLSPLFGPGSSPVTSVAPGADGSGGLAAFAGRQGVRNLDLFDSPGGLAASPNSADFPYGRRQRRATYFGSATYDVNPWLQVGVDGTYGRTIVDRGYDVQSADLTLAAASPLNPFGQDVKVSLNETAPLLGEGYSEARIEFGSAVLGLLLKLPADWRVSLDTQYAHNLTKYRGLAGADAARWQELVDTGRYNPLRDTQVHGPPPEYYDQVLLYQGARGHFVTLGNYDTVDASVRVTNQSLSLPAGVGAVNFGADYRRMHLADYTNVQRYGDGSVAADPVHWEGRILQRYSVFGEVQGPLVPPRHLPRWLHRVETDLALRYIAADTAKETYWAPTGGLKLELAGGFSLRGSFMLSSRYPTPFMSKQLAAGIGPGGGEVSQVLITDPVRNQQYAVPAQAAINPNLRPESAATQTAGIIFQRGRDHRVRVAVDFVDTRKTNEMITLDAQTLMDLESQFPGRVTRAPLGPGDTHAAGYVSSLLVGDINAARRHSQNWNVALDYLWTKCAGGTLGLHGRVVWFQRFERQVYPDSPPVDELRLPDGWVSGFLRYRANFGADWSKNDLGFGVEGHYYGSRVLPVAEWVSQGTAQIDRCWQFDAFLQGDLTRWLPWKSSRFGLRGQLRVNDLFGAHLPKYANDPSGAGVQPYGDWRGRTYSLSLTATF
jgi:outer membrane receptor protein involved in Fe transport